MYRAPQVAPADQLAEERRGQTLGRFCLVCAQIYPLHRMSHSGKPMYGKDHVSSPCAHEGEVFEAGAPWWQPAVEVLPAPVAPVAEAAAPVPGKAP